MSTQHSYPLSTSTAQLRTKQNMSTTKNSRANSVADQFIQNLIATDEYTVIPVVNTKRHVQYFSFTNSSYDPLPNLCCCSNIPCYSDRTNVQLFEWIQTIPNCNERVAAILSSKFSNIHSFIRQGMASSNPKMFVYDLEENTEDQHGQRIISIAASSNISTCFFQFSGDVEMSCAIK